MVVSGCQIGVALDSAGDYDSVNELGALGELVILKLNFAENLCVVFTMNINPGLADNPR